MARHLPEDPIELRQLDLIKARLIKGDSDPDQIAEVEEWERKAKKSLIILNTKKHDGVQLIVEQALAEISAIDDELRNMRPDDLSEKTALNFAHGVVMLQDQKRLWNWFIDLFGVAASDLEAIRGEISKEVEGQDEEEPEKPDDV